MRRAWWVGGSEWHSDGVWVPIQRHVRNRDMAGQKRMADCVRVEGESMFDLIIVERAHESRLGRWSFCEAPEAAFIHLIGYVKSRMNRCARLAVEVLFQNVANNAIDLTA